jgi:hypothetical protein
VSPAAAEGFLHTFSGWLLFVVAFIGLVAVERMLARLHPRSSPASGVEPRQVSA